MNILARLVEPNIFEKIEEIIPTIGNKRKIKKSHFTVSMLTWIAMETHFDLMEPHVVINEKRYYILRSFYYNGQKYFIHYYMLESELDLIDLEKDRKFCFFAAGSKYHENFAESNIFE